jgi:hypothetical protein
VVPNQKRKQSLQHDTVFNRFLVEKSTASAPGEHIAEVLTALHPIRDAFMNQPLELSTLTLERLLSPKKQFMAQTPPPQPNESIRHQVSSGQ